MQLFGVDECMAWAMIPLPIAQDILQYRFWIPDIMLNYIVVQCILGIS